MQLRLDAADRLVELVEERHGAVPVEEAARGLFALAHLPEGMARSLLDDVGAVRVERLEVTTTMQTLVNPNERLPPPVAALTGIDGRDLRTAPSVGTATRRFLAFAGDAVLVAH